MADSPPACPFTKIYPSALERDDTYYMKLAFNQAIDAWRADEVPIGAVVEYGGELIAAAHNQTVSARDPTAHAEMLALTQAANRLGDWRLNGATFYVTKEPCPMCSGAMIMGRVGRVVFGMRDSKMGCLGGATDLNDLAGSNHRCVVDAGILEEECRQLVQAYFQMKRKKSPPSAEEA
ncbi:MAG: tRNA adenosine(34) deaminase TadA [Opitutales bacterium]